MPSKWFRLPETGDGSEENPYRPDLLGYEIDGWTGNKNPDADAPIWYVRVYADESTIQALADEPRAQPLGYIPVSAMAAILGYRSSRSGIEARFAVGENRLSYRWE